MTTTVIQLRDLDAAIRKAISERGEDYIYPQIDGTCFYRSEVIRGEDGTIKSVTGPAGCLIGSGFDTLGVLPKEMGFGGFWEEGDGPREGASASQLAGALDLEFHHDGIDVTDGVKVALLYLQGSQDAADTWGTAYARHWLVALAARTPTATAAEEFRKAWAER